MASVNKTILLGNVGKDPEVKYTASGAAICNISLATTRTWKNKETGERQEETEWHRVVFYDKLAEIAGQYAKKGRPVYVEGRLKTRKWSDKDGIERYTTEVIASELVLLGGRDSAESEPSAPAATRRSAPPPRASQAGPKATGFDDMEDDIPFATSSIARDMTSLADRRMRRYRF